MPKTVDPIVTLRAHVKAAGSVGMKRMDGGGSMSYDDDYTEFYLGKSKTAVAPKRSWWLDCTTREEFMARHAHELPRLCPQPEIPKGGVVPTLRRF